MCRNSKNSQSPEIINYAQNRLSPVLKKLLYFLFPDFSAWTSTGEHYLNNWSCYLFTTEFYISLYYLEPAQKEKMWKYKERPNDEQCWHERTIARVITHKPRNFRRQRIFPTLTIFLNAFAKLRGRSIRLQQSTLSSKRWETGGLRAVLLIQRKSSYANVPRDIHREFSQGYRSPSEAQISSRPISSARANCVHTICEVENCEISAEAARLPRGR